MANGSIKKVDCVNPNLPSTKDLITKTKNSLSIDYSEEDIISELNSWRRDNGGFASDVYPSAEQLTEYIINKIEKVSYTKSGKKFQYGVLNNHIFNKQGKEVFSKNSTDRVKILTNSEFLKHNAVKVKNPLDGRLYVVNRKGDIVSITTGKKLKWDDNNGNRKAILAEAKKEFEKLKDTKSDSNKTTTGSKEFYHNNPKQGSTENTTVTTIISGGQTGVDTYGLEVAEKLGLYTGGIAPKGFKREQSSSDNTDIKKYGLREITDEEKGNEDSIY